MRRHCALQQELIERHRQIADALSGRVVDRVGDRHRNADDADFANTFDAERRNANVGIVSPGIVTIHTGWTKKFGKFQ
jgi:hypothetical protein